MKILTTLERRKGESSSNLSNKETNNAYKSTDSNSFIESIHGYFPDADKSVRNGSRHTHSSHSLAKTSICSIFWKDRRVRAFGNRNDLILSDILRWLFPTNYYNHVIKMIVIMILSFFVLAQIWNLFHTIMSSMCDRNPSQQIPKYYYNCNQSILMIVSASEPSNPWIRTILFAISFFWVIHLYQEILMSLKDNKIWMNPTITEVRS